MTKLDCLIIHVPKFYNYYKPFGDTLYIKSMALGLLAMADYLAENGHPAKVLHLGVEYVNNDNFDMIDYIEKKDPKVVGISLHWHSMSYDVIEVAREIKNHFPSK